MLCQLELSQRVVLFCNCLLTYEACKWYLKERINLQTYVRHLLLAVSLR